MFIASEQTYVRYSSVVWISGPGLLSAGVTFFLGNDRGHGTFSPVIPAKRSATHHACRCLNVTDED